MSFNETKNINNLAMYVVGYSAKMYENGKISFYLKEEYNRIKDIKI